MEKRKKLRSSLYGCSFKILKMNGDDVKMLTIDLKSRFRNKAFILAMIGAIVLLIQQLGFKDLIPSNYADVVNSILGILTMIGIVIDTSTKGVSDQTISNITASGIIADENTKQEVQVKDSTTSINNKVTENSENSSADASIIPTDKESENINLVSDHAAVLAENEQLKATLATIQSAALGTKIQV
jgi:phi LC3 family holin